jgi:hypothetical protein
MAIAVTSRHVYLNAATANTTSANTDSVTPTASSHLVVCYGVIGTAVTTEPAMTDPSGGSLTYTLAAKDGEGDGWAYNGFATNKIAGGIWTAPVGGSPSAFAITLTGGGANFIRWGSAIDVTGHNTVSPVRQSKVSGGNIPAAGDSESRTVVLDSAVVAGNLLVVHIGVGQAASAEPALPTAGSGKTFTSIHSNSATFRTSYRILDGAESQTITCSDLGQGVGNYFMVATEIAAAAGGTKSPPFRSRRIQPNLMRK